MSRRISAAGKFQSDGAAFRGAVFAVNTLCCAV